VWLQKKLTLSVWLKSYLVIWNMIASLGSVRLQKTVGSFVIAKNLFCVLKMFFHSLVVQESWADTRGQGWGH
jgi:hypothetical protein